MALTGDSATAATSAGVAVPLSPHAILGHIRDSGITHVVTVPDTHQKSLLALLAESTEPQLITTCTEDEAMGVNVGLYIGGMRPLLLIQNSGFYAANEHRPRNVPRCPSASLPADRRVRTSAQCRPGRPRNAPRATVRTHNWQCGISPSTDLISHPTSLRFLKRYNEPGLTAVRWRCSSAPLRRTCDGRTASTH
jgi:hypothetical protein